MISDVARGEQGGLFFAVLCVAKPIFTATFARNLYATSEEIFPIFSTDPDHHLPGFILYAINETYLRSVALNSLATEKHYKQEVLSGALESYIKNGMLLINFVQNSTHLYLRIRKDPGSLGRDIGRIPFAAVFQQCYTLSRYHRRSSGRFTSGKCIVILFSQPHRSTCDRYTTRLLLSCTPEGCQ